MQSKTVIFAGFGGLGYQCLRLLLDDGFEINSVLTHQDMSEVSVDGLANTHSIPFSYVDLRNNPISLFDLQQLACNYLISVNYRFILPLEILKSVKYPLNIHGSLLPQYRGRTPHVWAIINGESKAGISCHIMDASVDTGDIYHQIGVDIKPDDTGASLLSRYEALYPDCLSTTLKKIHNNIPAQSQDESRATYFGKRNPDMGYLDITKTARSLIDFIRAQSHPYPGAYCYLPNGNKLIVHKAEIVKINNISNIQKGQVVKFNDGYLCKVSDGCLYFSDFVEDK